PPSTRPWGRSARTPTPCSSGWRRTRGAPRSEVGRSLHRDAGPAAQRGAGLGRGQRVPVGADRGELGRVGDQGTGLDFGAERAAEDRPGRAQAAADGADDAVAPGGAGTGEPQAADLGPRARSAWTDLVGGHLDAIAGAEAG